MTDTAAAQGFLILHGWQNRRPAGHWQHWLADRLADLGHEVDYPQLPDPDHPRLEVWLAELRTRLAALRGPRRTVVCHSLACALWLHAAARDAVPVTVDRVLLVAPPSPDVLERHPEVRAFVPPRVGRERLTDRADHTRIVAGDDDPYCPEGAVTAYGASLRVPVDVLTGAAHLGPDSGYGPWPSVLDWCLAPTGHPRLRRRTGTDHTAGRTV